ncbi:ScbA/BarX family gamma-butyrolactone biosynthesis protein [Streptomyces sp. ZAF1911]|uniref:ScbA/BarX family gamma-butyrolactone biosynthesis protein n=1 Tax=unclassified Streptomyces TaxID=2593676 RepID=UPI00237C41F7|nr:ScbA/BarX family gamma-butyrolactone biosynthesis protein [Streptomyces sp. ZAF1911]MDD9382998.1 ScbA/BarX family gamma-butyrolactone biosynthesis protein [Streptomyces sp. ZAF1911]
MTTAPARPQAQPAPPAWPTLEYSRTVNRLLVHRDALNEVFLTDLQPVDEASYAAGAQLPRSHAYYGDHLLRPLSHDPLLILEACRQAGLAGAHRFFGVAMDHKFILTHMSLHLSHPQQVTVGPAPGALALHVRIADRKERDGRVTGLDYEFDLSVDGSAIGTATLGLRFKSPTGYLTLRLNNRDGYALPSSATYPHSTPGTPIPPHLVGRASLDNVVLVEPALTHDSASALLRVPVRHASLFDHPQDHLPGMVIAEGARQLALFAALELRGMSTAKTLATDIDVRFTRFGELEDDTVLTAEIGPRPRSGPGVAYTQGGLLELPDDGAEQLPVRVEATQKGQSLCVFTFLLTRVAAQ